MARLNKFLAVLVLFLFPSSFGWADIGSMTVDQLVKSNEELRKTVKELTNKVDNLEGRLTKAEHMPQSVPVNVPAPQGTDGVLRTAGGDIRLDGFVDTSFNWNFTTPPTPAGGTNATGNTTLRAFDRASNTFDLNNVQLHIFRPAPDAGGVGFDTKFDYGTDAGVMQSAPFDTTSGFTIQQAYVEIKAPVGSGITIWAGKFPTLLGAEVIENYLNWNASRSLLFNNAIPFTHTGIRAMYNWFGGKIATTLGLVNGWDMVIDNNNFKDVEASIKWTPNENFNIAENFIGGPQKVESIGRHRLAFDTVATWKPLPKSLPKLSLMGNYDYVWENKLGKGIEGGGADWQGYAVYARYEVNDRIALAARWEQFWDDQGVRTGLASLNDLWEMTYTADFKVYKNLLTRLEYRHDYGNSNTSTGNRGPFDGATRRSQDTVGASLIYLFG